MDRYLQMPKEELVTMVQKNLYHYLPKPARRIYIDKANGKKRPLGIPTVMDRIIQECVKSIIEPICEAKFYPYSYGFRPYRAQKHAIRQITNIINGSTKSKQQPVWALEGDIKGCFDNINHRLLLNKLWKIGIHDKRVLKLISQMLKAGYVESGILVDSKIGTGQGAIISPLLANVYLNDFDWYIARQYCQPFRQCKHICNDTRRLRWAGVTPKYNIRFADDWVIMTSSKYEAERLKRRLTKYFKYRMKLELSEEKTKVTDLRTDGIKFLGFVVKAEKPRSTPNKRPQHLIGKPYPDMERLSKKIRNICTEIKKMKMYTSKAKQIAQIMYINSVIMGIAEYIKIGISSHAFNAIDRRVNNSAFSVWKRIYPKAYNTNQIRLKHLSNLPHRHKDYDSKTFAVKHEGKWVGFTMAFITHVKYEAKPFNQKMTPYTAEGRKIYVNYRKRNKPLPLDRPSINTASSLKYSLYSNNKMNFEYYMNREYAFNRDRGKCRCCKVDLWDNDDKRCHHVNNRLPLYAINKVPNLAWVCNNCHRMIHNGPIPDEIDKKVLKRIINFKNKLEKAKS